jgi:hypothetical protein
MPVAVRLLNQIFAKGFAVGNSSFLPFPDEK